MTEETLTNLIPWTQLGLSAIFLLMVWVLWKKIEEKDKKIEERDVKQNAQSEKLMGVLERNTTAIDAQVKSNETLSQYIYDAIKRK